MVPKICGQFFIPAQLQFLIFLKNQMRHVGTMGAFDFQWDVPSCEIGYWLSSDHTGRGYMTEAVHALTEMLRRQIKVRRVQIRCDAENVRSRRVSELAGFQLEGILRCDCVAEGGRLRNTCVYSRIYDAGDQELSHG